MKFIPALSAILITASTWAADTVAWPERIVRGVNTNFQVGEEDISHYAAGGTATRRGSWSTTSPTRSPPTRSVRRRRPRSSAHWISR